jgi:hypothetical protein
MMDQEHQTQLDEQEFLLKLEQDEETENLRKVRHKISRSLLNHSLISKSVPNSP